jgi:hypothetical protein
MNLLRTDLLLSFLGGIAAMAVAAYLFWRYAGQPPSE